MSGWLNKINPFSAPDFLQDLESATMENALGSWELIATKALHGSILINQIAFLGLFIKALRLGNSEHVTVYSLAQDLTPLEWVGMVVALYATLMFLKYLSQYFTRAIVMIAGFSISLQPGQIIRNYVYPLATKVYLLCLMILGLMLHFTLWLNGVGGLFEFLIPKFAIWFSTPIFICIVLAYVIASVILPATRIRVQNEEELFELLLENDATRALRLHYRLREQLVTIAAKALIPTIIADVQARGAGALFDWTFIPAAKWEALADTMRVPRAKFADLKEIRARIIKGQVTHVALKKGDGKIQIHDEESLR